MLRQRLLEVGQAVTIGEFRVRVISVSGDTVTLSIEAPPHRKVYDPEDPARLLASVESAH